MSALLTPFKLLRGLKKRARKISSVHLPTELWLWICPLLTQRDLRALSGVCFTFRHIFEPYLDFKVSVDCSAKPRHFKRRLFALDSRPSLLAHISEITIEMSATKPYSMKSLRVFKPRNERIVSAFLRNTSRMTRLHTVHFFDIHLRQKLLAPLFLSNTVHTLILSQCDLCTMDGLPLARIRHLTLTSISTSKWPRMVALFGHCSANLETLSLTGELRKSYLKPPIFPKLRKLSLVIHYGSPGVVCSFIPLTPQLEHLEFWTYRDMFRLPDLPASLNRLSTSERTIELCSFGPHPFLHLSYLRIHFNGWVEDRGSRLRIIPIIQHTFPNVTSLEFDIHNYTLGFYLLFTRTVPNVTRLQLNISGNLHSLLHDDTNMHFTETPEGPLSRLYVKVPVGDAHKKTMKLLKEWVLHTVLRATVGLGGPHLQEVEMVFSESRTITPVAWWYWKQVKEEWCFEQY